VVVISKDEESLDGTLSLVREQAEAEALDVELVVVDASSRRLDWIRRRHPTVQWLDYEPPPGVRISIPHQRNVGVGAADGDVIVFVDAGCAPRAGWLRGLLRAIVDEGEDVVAGPALPSEENGSHYGIEVERVVSSRYLDEAPTLNLAFRRTVFDTLRGFDERFEYGSDVDFSWRVLDAGYRIRSAPDAVVEHDWGTARRQLRRAYLYGRARARLYQKHRSRWGRMPRRDPVVIAYPLFILGLPLITRFRWYPLLLLIPAWRARDHGALSVVADHLAYGVGVLSIVAGW
jgi:GT2 family glycosyltransferase